MFNLTNDTIDGVNIEDMVADMRKVISLLQSINHSAVESFHNTGISTEDAAMADDAIWILTSTTIIFTMQSGFGLLESGSVSTKNEVNIMVKNTIDVIFGGFTFWLFGYSFSFGEEPPYSNFFNGWGNFLAFSDAESIGDVYSKFFFQASFATTATTIVSGAMAERTRLEAYIVFSLLNTLVYCFPAHWVWSPKGWLAKMGMIDLAGCGPIHVVGGVTGLVATIILKPRHGRFAKDAPEPMMGSPTNVILGTFMLCYIWKKRIFDVAYLVNSILGSLVGITALCALAEPWESFIIGAIGAIFALLGSELMLKLKVDDPVSCVGVHAFGGFWGLISVGLFKDKDILSQSVDVNPESKGLFYGGGFYLLGVQALAFVAIAVWTAIISFLMLKAIDLFVPLRMPLHEEILGSDIVEHGLGDEEHIKSALVFGASSQNSNGLSALSELGRRVSVAHQGAYGAKYNRQRRSFVINSALASTLPPSIQSNLQLQKTFAEEKDDSLVRHEKLMSCLCCCKRNNGAVDITDSSQEPSTSQAFHKTNEHAEQNGKCHSQEDEPKVDHNGSQHAYTNEIFTSF